MTCQNSTEPNSPTSGTTSRSTSKSEWSAAILDAIEKVAAILDRADKWTKGTHARDAEGRPVHWSDPKAVSFCLIGACAKATANGKTAVGPLFVPLFDEVEKRLRTQIAHWNDSEHRTFTDVLHLIERMRKIKLAEVKKYAES